MVCSHHQPTRAHADYEGIGINNRLREKRINYSHSVSGHGCKLVYHEQYSMEKIAYRSELKKGSAVIGLADLTYELKTLGEAECVIMLKIRQNLQNKPW